MASIKSKDFLKTLIQTGADANLNLFEVSFLPADKTLYDSKLSYRTTEAPSIVTRNSSTVDLPYMNTEITRISTGTAITKTQSFQIRVDLNYKIIETLRKYQCIDESGYFLENKKKQMQITVDALKPRTDLYSFSEYESVYRWIFKNCYITTIDPLTFSYSSANNGTVNVTFVWGSYEESFVGSDNDRLELASSSDVVSSLFDAARNGWDSLFD